MEFLLLLALPLLALAFGVGDLLDSEGLDDEDDADQNLEGSAGNDVIIGALGDDTITGNDGDDTLVGAEGDDSLRGGFGNDIVDGSEGDDFARGGAGDDLVLGFTGDDTLDGDSGNDIVLGEAGNDLISLGGGNDVSWVDDEVSDEAFLTGQLGDDTIYGGAGDDNIWDYSGEDSLFGGYGDDRMSATDNQLADWNIAPHAPDLVVGGAGNDLLIGDDGDTLTGGSDADTFVSVSESVDDNLVVVSDYNGNEDGLILDLLREAHGPTDDWSLTSRAGSNSGEVIVSLVNVVDASDVVDFVTLTNPVNFNISQVSLQWH